MGWYSVLLVALLIAGTQAFAPIHFVKAPGNGMILIPKNFQRSATGLSAPQELMIGKPDKNYPDVPYFTANADNTITWDDVGWCVEATGRKSGAVVRINQCNGKASQKWNWIPDGHGRNMIQLKDSDQCLDANGGLVGSIKIQLQNCADHVTASWKFAFEDSLPVQTRASTQRFGSDVRVAMISLLALAGVGLLGLSAWLWRQQHKASMVTVGHGVSMAIRGSNDVQVNEARSMGNVRSAGNISMMAEDENPKLDFVSKSLMDVLIIEKGKDLIRGFMFESQSRPLFAVEELLESQGLKETLSSKEGAFSAKGFIETHLLGEFMLNLEGDQIVRAPTVIAEVHKRLTSLRGSTPTAKTLLGAQDSAEALDPRGSTPTAEPLPSKSEAPKLEELVAQDSAEVRESKTDPAASFQKESFTMKPPAFGIKPTEDSASTDPAAAPTASSAAPTYLSMGGLVTGFGSTAQNSSKAFTEKLFPADSSGVNVTAETNVLIPKTEEAPKLEKPVAQDSAEVRELKRDPAASSQLESFKIDATASSAASSSAPKIEKPGAQKAAEVREPSGIEAIIEKGQNLVRGVMFGRHSRPVFVVEEVLESQGIKETLSSKEGGFSSKGFIETHLVGEFSVDLQGDQIVRAPEETPKGEKLGAQKPAEVREPSAIIEKAKDMIRGVMFGRYSRPVFIVEEVLESQGIKETLSSKEGAFSSKEFIETYLAGEFTMDLKGDQIVRAPEETLTGEKLGAKKAAGVLDPRGSTSTAKPVQSKSDPYKLDKPFSLTPPGAQDSVEVRESKTDPEASQDSSTKAVTEKLDAADPSGVNVTAEATVSTPKTEEAGAATAPLSENRTLASVTPPIGATTQVQPLDSKKLMVDPRAVEVVKSREPKRTKKAKQTAQATKPAHVEVLKQIPIEDLIAEAKQIVGQQLPSVEIDYGSLRSPLNAKVNIYERVKDKKVILVGLPGAFAPASSAQVNGYLEKHAELKAKGIEEVIFYCCNDGAVMNAWAAMTFGATIAGPVTCDTQPEEEPKILGRNSGIFLEEFVPGEPQAKNNVTFMGDPSAVLTDALKLRMRHPEPSGALDRLRCHRHALYVENGVVKALEVAASEEDPAGDDVPHVTLVESMLKVIPDGPSSGVERDFKGRLEHLTRAYDVVLFSNSTCALCKETKEAFTNIDEYPGVFELDNEHTWGSLGYAQDILEDMTGSRSEPWVFVGGKFVGGGADTVALAEDGKLKELVDATLQRDLVQRDPVLA